VDAVDVGATCGRRWYVFIPVVVIGVLASVHVASHSSKTYESTGQFVILPAAVQQAGPRNPPTKPKPTHAPAPERTVVVEKPAASSPAPGRKQRTASASPRPTTTPTSPAASPTPTAIAVPTPTTTALNPFESSTDLLRVALVADLNSTVFRQQVAPGGATFIVTIPRKTPVLTVTGDSDSKARAPAVVSAVLAQVNARLQQVQVNAGAPGEGLLQAHVIKPATPPKDATSGTSKRLTIGIALTVAIAMALAVGLDWHLGRRRVRAVVGPDGSDDTDVERGPDPR